jgi:hypothetical protein
MHPTLFFNTRIHLVPDGATELLAKDALERESAVVPDRPSMAVVSGPQGCDVEDVGVESVRFGEQDGYQQVAHSAQRVGISGKWDAGPFGGCGGGDSWSFVAWSLQSVSVHDRGVCWAAFVAWWLCWFFY